MAKNRIALGLGVGLPLCGNAAGVAELDSRAVAIVTPDRIPWGPVTPSVNQQVVLLGEPARPGPYIVMVRWLSRCRLK